LKVGKNIKIAPEIYKKNFTQLKMVWRDNITQQQRDKLHSIAEQNINPNLLDGLTLSVKLSELWNSAESLRMFIQSVTLLLINTDEQSLWNVLEIQQNINPAKRDREECFEEEEMEAKRSRIQVNCVRINELDAILSSKCSDEVMKERDELMEATTSLIQQCKNNLLSIEEKLQYRINNIQLVGELLEKHKHTQLVMRKLQHSIAETNLKIQFLENEMLEEHHEGGLDQQLEALQILQQENKETMVRTNNEYQQNILELRKYDSFGEVAGVLKGQSLAQYCHISGNSYERNGQSHYLLKCSSNLRERISRICSISSEHLMRVTNQFEENGSIYVETPYYTYVTLQEHTKGKTVMELLLIIQQIAKAISDVHKSGNICAGLRDRIYVRIENFHKVIPAVCLYSDSSSSAPEIQREENPSIASDVWDFGIVVCHMLSNQFRMPDIVHPGQFLSDVTEQLREDVRGNVYIFDLISNALQIDGSKRQCIDYFIRNPQYSIGISNDNGTPIICDNVKVMKDMIQIIRDKSQEAKAMYALKVHNVLQVLQKIGNLRRGQFIRTFKVEFVNEVGIDQGALRTSLYMRIFDELINQRYIIKHENSTVYTLAEDDDRLDSRIFNSLGKLVGKIIFEGRTLPIPFAAHIWSSSFRNKACLDLVELSTVDPTTASSCKNILATPNAEDLYISYENADETPVTNDNRCHYISEKIYNQIVACRQKNLASFREGLMFIEYIPVLLSSMDIQSIQLLVDPQQTVDVNILITCLTFSEGCVTEERMFLNIIRCLSQVELKQFLKFVTGEHALFSPEQSATPLYNPNESAPIRDKIGIQFFGAWKEERLPTAHVCFYTVDMPRYKTEKVMKEKLLLAIGGCASDSFGNV
jgi:hypothetical protein